MRRRAVAGVALVLLLGACTSTMPDPRPSAPAAAARELFAAEIAGLETEFDARVGVEVAYGDERTLSHRADERFGFASSIKALIAAVALRTLSPAERAARLPWTAEDVTAAGYSPVLGRTSERAMTVDQLAETAVRTSDNAATNLVLRRLGGPAAVTAAFAAIGDRTTRLTREEPHLNDVTAGSADNTTTPAAFTAHLRSLFAGADPRLGVDERATLLRWMSGNTTGDALIRAGAPAGWAVADKSGGAGGLRTDIAVVTPPGCPPVFVSILTQRNDPLRKWDDALVRDTARAAFSVVRGTGC